jgi:hypothetical protein
MHNKHLILLCTALLMAGCSGSGTNDSTWSNVDYRHPVPTEGDASIYNDQYQDNDDNYTPPQSYGCTMDFGQVCE